jgi:hypothetical protein
VHNARSESGPSLKQGKENSVGLKEMRALHRISWSGSQYLVNMKVMQKYMETRFKYLNTLRQIRVEEER